MNQKNFIIPATTVVEEITAYSADDAKNAYPPYTLSGGS
jgi:hypothetical protein